MTLLASDPEAIDGGRTRTSGRSRRSARADRVALAVPTVVAAAATLTWFPFDRFLAGGDVTPFVRDGTARELFSYWNHRSTGTGSTSAGVAKAFEVVVLRFVGWFGGSEVVAQHVFFALVMGFAAFGIAYLARALVEDPIVVAVAGLLGVFNPFVLLHLPNPLAPVWLGVVATLSGMVLRAARGRPIPGVVFGIATLGASYISLNPPLLATAVATVVAAVAAASLLVGPGGSRRALRFVVRSLPWVVVLNLWWLVPTVLAAGHPEGVSLAAETRVEDWSWSHVRNSFPNVISLTADWSWRYPEYAPYANVLDSYPLSLARWILPGLAVAAPFVTHGSRRRTSWVLLATAGAVAVVAKGLHPPFVGFNLALYHHVPGMWLLREPMSKVGGLLLIAEVLLAALTVSSLLRRLTRLPEHRQRVGAAVLGCALCVALIFPFPLWTGGFASDGHHGLPSARVAVPDAWRRVAAAVNDTPGPGKVLVLPLNRFYQVTTDWGFHGADELVPELVDRSVLALLPGGYFEPGGRVTELMQETERLLAAGGGPGAVTLLRALGVSQVVLRRDLAPTRTATPGTEPDLLANGLAATPEVSARESFGVADLYRLHPGTPPVWGAREVTGLARREAQDWAGALAELGAGVAAVAPRSVPLDSLSWEASGGTSSSVDFSLRETRRYAVATESDGPASWSLRVRERDGVSRLELTDPATVLLDGERLVEAPTLRVPIGDVDADVDLVGIGGTLSVLPRRGRQIALEGPTHIDAYAPVGPRVTAGTFAPADFCGPVPPGTGRPTSDAIRGGVRLRSQLGLACTSVAGFSPSPDNVHRLRLEVRNRSGVGPRLCLWETGPKRCADIAPLPSTSRWSTIDVPVRTDPDAGRLVLFLYADASGGRADVEYRNVSLTAEQLVGGGEVTPRARSTETRRLDRGPHRLLVAQPQSEVKLRPDSPLGDCAKSDDRSAEEVGLRIERRARAVQLSASGHTACVTAAIPGASGGDRLELSLDARTISGRAARLCVWQVGPNRCAETEPLPTDSSWEHYRSVVTLEPGTTSASVFLYADGQAEPKTVTAYRALTVRAVVPEIVTIRPSAPDRPARPVVSEQHGSSRFSVATGDSGSRLIVLDEGFAPGWSISGVRDARHVEVNGYANGWYLPSAAPVDAELTFGPARIVRAMLPISLVGLAVAGLLLAWFAGRRRGGHEHWAWTRRISERLRPGVDPAAVGPDRPDAAQ